MQPIRMLVTLVAGFLVQPVIADEDHSDRYDRYDRYDRHDRYGRYDHSDHADLANAVFGRGLNTAAPGNAVNHVVIPKRIEINTGGVVDFSVAGFHDIVIFKPGFKKRDLDALLDSGSLPLAGLFIVPSDPAEALPAGFEFLADQLYYRGINPVPPGNAGPVDNTFNRGEPVAFLEPGTYFVFCNVLPHYNDGMFAYVEVKSGHDYRH